MALATEWAVVVVAMVATDHPAEVSGFSLRFLHLNSSVENDACTVCTCQNCMLNNNKGGGGGGGGAGGGVCEGQAWFENPVCSVLIPH